MPAMLRFKIAGREIQPLRLMSATLEVILSEKQLDLLADKIAKKMRNAEASTYSIAEAAAVLGVCSKTVARRVEAGILPHLPNIRPIRIPAESIDRLLNPSTPE
jgi:hypothetical protein